MDITVHFPDFQHHSGLPRGKKQQVAAQREIKSSLWILEIRQKMDYPAGNPVISSSEYRDKESDCHSE